MSLFRVMNIFNFPHGIFLFCLFSMIECRELKFVQAIWRHGDRAPSNKPYPNDPNDESSWPRGWNQLTNVIF